MARVSRPNASPQDPQSLRPLDPILPRHTALLAIFVMLIAILFFNIASYSLGAMAESTRQDANPQRKFTNTPIR